jgi:hypothetical protein
MDMGHPYKSAPDRAFWKRAVSDGWRLDEVPDSGDVLLRHSDGIASAGSCFAANIVPYLEKAGLIYLKKQRIVPPLGQLNNDNFSYSKFSAEYGNIYTVRQALQLVRRARGEFSPIEDRWRIEGLIIDPFRPGLRFPATSDEEFDLLMAQYLENVRSVLCDADVFIFTLGLTEAWLSKSDGAVFPACPGTIRGKFDPNLHEFHNFTFDEVRADLFEFIRLVRMLNAGMRFILTVSPVPLVATMTKTHVLTASIYSKSVLRVASAEAATNIPNVAYFPAYEIVTGPQAPFDYFEADRREPSRAAIEAVMQAFLSRCEVRDANIAMPVSALVESLPTPRHGVGGEDVPTALRGFSDQPHLSKVLAQVECEEAACGM